MFMQVQGAMMDFDCFKWNFVIFDIGNKYQDIYTNLYKLKSDFVVVM